MLMTVLRKIVKVWINFENFIKNSKSYFKNLKFLRKFSLKFGKI